MARQEPTRSPGRHPIVVALTMQPAPFILTTHLARRNVVSAVKLPHKRGTKRTHPIGFTRWTLEGWVGVDRSGTPVGVPRETEHLAAIDVYTHTFGVSP